MPAIPKRNTRSEPSTRKAAACSRDDAEAAKLLGAAAVGGNLDAMTEYSIALYNGTGVPKDEARAAGMLLRAARRGSAIAQNRLARVLASGRGLPADPIEAVKWHLISKAGGATDLYLDEFARKQAPNVREAAEKAAKPWLDMIAASRS